MISGRSVCASELLWPGSSATEAPARSSRESFDWTVSSVTEPPLRRDVEIGLKLIGPNGAGLILDGQSEQLRPISPGDTVFVRRGSASFCQISFRSFDWFAAFQSKFNYQIRRGGLEPTVPDDEDAR